LLFLGVAPYAASYIGSKLGSAFSTYMSSHTGFMFRGAVSSSLGKTALMAALPSLFWYGTMIVTYQVGNEPYRQTLIAQADLDNVEFNLARLNQNTDSYLIDNLGYSQADVAALRQWWQGYSARGKMDVGGVTDPTKRHAPYEGPMSGPTPPYSEGLPSTSNFDFWDWFERNKIWRQLAYWDFDEAYNEWVGKGSPKVKYGRNSKAFLDSGLDLKVWLAMSPAEQNAVIDMLYKGTVPELPPSVPPEYSEGGGTTPSVPPYVPSVPSVPGASVPPGDGGGYVPSGGSGYSPAPLGQYSYWDDFDSSTKEYWLGRGVDKTKFNAWRAAMMSGLPVAKLEDMFPEFYDRVDQSLDFDATMQLLYQLGDVDVDPRTESERDRDPRNWTSKDVIWPSELYNLRLGRKPFKGWYRRRY